jgi:predicted nucleic acid-binding protein
MLNYYYGKITENRMPDAIVAATALVNHARLLTLDKRIIQGLQRLGFFDK